MYIYLILLISIWKFAPPAQVVFAVKGSFLYKFWSVALVFDNQKMSTDMWIWLFRGHMFELENTFSLDSWSCISVLSGIDFWQSCILILCARNYLHQFLIYSDIYFVFVFWKMSLRLEKITNLNFQSKKPLRTLIFDHWMFKEYNYIDQWSLRIHDLVTFLNVILWYYILTNKLWI